MTNDSEEVSQKSSVCEEKNTAAKSHPGRYALDTATSVTLLCVGYCAYSERNRS